MDKKQEISLIECFVKLFRDIKIICNYQTQSKITKRKFCAKHKTNINKNIKEKEMQ